MQDRVPTKVLANGAIRYAVYDEEGNFLRHEYMLPADEPTQDGMPFCKETILKDATAALYGKGADAVPDDVFGFLGKISNINIPVWNKLKSYESAGSYTWTVPDLFNGKPYLIGVLVIGAGGAGAIYLDSVSSGTAPATGGASGESICFTRIVSPLEQINIIVGAKGAAAELSYASTRGGNSGGTSSFDGKVAHGGSGGSPNYMGASGGQPSFQVDGSGIPFGGAVVKKEQDLPYSSLLSCFNPFENKRILGAGAWAKDGFSKGTGSAGTDPITGLGGGAGRRRGSAYDATANGCGGGACAYNGYGSGTYHSGAGADGAVYIYARRALS